jgi:hypothetical protein
LATEAQRSRSKTSKVLNGSLAVIGVLATVIGLSVDWPAFSNLVLGRTSTPRAELGIAYAFPGGETFAPIESLPGELPSGGARLKLSVPCQEEAKIYLLSIDGEGRTSLRALDDLQEEKQRRRGADGCWMIPWNVDGPPATETLLVVSSSETLDQSEFAARIEALNLKPRLPDHTHLLWGSSGWEAVATGVTARDIGEWESAADLDWANRLLDVLRSTEGLQLSGRTYPVSSRRRE